jgi:putative transcriptional regulator
MIEPQDIVALLRELLLSLDLTQAEFAARLGVTFPTVNRRENRHSKLSRMAVKFLEGLLRQTGENTQDLLKYFLN